MKIRRILTAFLAVLMASACMSIVAFAADEAELMAVEPIKLLITSAGAKDQSCTKKDGVIDSLGRTVQQIFPDSSVNANGTVAPAWFADGTQKAAIRNSNYAYGAIKLVYYTSKAGGVNPTLTMYYENGGAWTQSNGKGTLKAGGAAQAGKWQTAVFELPSQWKSDVCHAFMFYPFGSESVQKQLGETIYIGYIALFDTAENAIAHKSDFEGDLVLSGINVGGTAVAGFSASTKSYTVDLKGADAVPEITVTGKGNSNDLKIEKSAYDSTNGTATATVTAGANVYTLNFTGGAKATGLAPIELTYSYAGLDQGVSGINNINDEFGRAIKDYKPAYGTQNGKYKDYVINPGGDFGSASTGDYKVMKVVYRTSESRILSLSANTKDWKSCSDGVAVYDVAPEANKWNVVYFNLHNTNGNIFYYQTRLSQDKASVVETTKGAYHQIAYGGLFGSLLDAKAHKTPFEGELNITSVKVGGEDVTFEGGVANVDANGAATVPEITLTATGNTNDLVIENGEFDTNGNATSTVKNGGKTLYTVNFTGGDPKEITPAVMNFEWTGAGAQGVASATKITDEFTRTYTRFIPALTYIKDLGNGNYSDEMPTVPCSPGGSAQSIIPEGMSASDYEVVKVVVRSNEDYAPVLQHYRISGATTLVEASNKSDFVKDKWVALYYPIEKGNFKMYQYRFSSDASPNHPAGVYDIAYGAMFGSLEDAKAYKTPFEGEFTITDVLLDGESVGNVSTYTKDLEGAGTLPKLTVVATGDAEGVKVTNGVINAEGKATSTVTKNGSALVTVSFTGGSTEFKIVDILVDGVSLPDFSPEKAEYTVDLGFAAPKPSVTYTYQGVEETVTVDVAATTEDGLTSKYVATLTKGTEVLYTITFNVDTNKPDALLNTLYKLNADKKLTVAYLGGSVTAGSGATNANLLSWRGITRDWFKSTFPEAAVTEINAAIGGQGAIFGVFRNQQHVLKRTETVPDLLFVETVVNDSYDGTYNDNSYIRYTESIIKQTLAANPKCDIILVVTGDSGTFSQDAASETPVYGLGYDYLAQRYDIPVVHVGFELAHAIKDEFGANFSTSSEGWGKYFKKPNGSVDGVHPNDAGYAHYAKTIIDKVLEPNLPVSYTPKAEEYAAKTNPEGSYSETKGYGSIMIDADMVTAKEFVGNKSLGGYTASSVNDLGSSSLKSYSAGQVVSFEFNSSNLGIWTWSYGTANGKNGTDIAYSIDGGEVKTANLYRSYPNHKCYYLAQGLDNSKTHTIRIYHKDSKNPVDIRAFLMWGMPEGEAASITAVPYFDFEKETYKVTLDGEVFDFNPDVLTNEIPVQLTAGESYPVLGFDVRDDFYGYAITQATEETGIATLEIDNVGKYTFAFVNGTSIKVSGTTDATYGKDDGTVTFEEAAEYAFQLKTSDEDWTDAVTYDAGTLKVTDLAAGKYNVRYIIEDGVYGLSTSFVVGIVYPYDNVYYVTTGGTGDGKSFGNPADAGSSVGVLVSNAAAFFGDKATTEDCYVILVGEVVHSSNATVINSALYKNLTIMGGTGHLFRMRTHISFAGATAASGYLTFKDIDIVLGNPAATTSNYNSEIMIDAKANGITFDNFNIVEFATCSTGETRTDVICLNYWADGATGAVGLGRPVTVNTVGKTFSVARGTGYNTGDESGDAKFVINGGTVPTVKMGGHVNAEKHTGVFRAEINGGEITTLMLSGDSATSNIGSVIATVNGGTIGTATVASTASDESAVDRVLILNNGMSIATINNKTKVDYILKGGIGGSAEAVTNDSKRLSGFVFTTDKETVVINKGLTGEKVLTVTGGTAELAIADLAAGEYTVTYEDAPKPEGYVEIKTEIALGREVGKVPASGNHLTLVITNKATGELVKKVDLEAADTAVGDNGKISVDVELVLGATDENTVYKVELKKNGYATITESFVGDDLVKYLASYVAGKAETFEDGHGDIKGAYDAESGDGKVDIDDFIRVVRGFDSTATAEYSALVDLDEDGAITVKDLAIVKRNFGFDAEGLLT